MAMTVANGDARAAAVATWQAAAAEGVELTGAELAERFDRSPSWGRAMAREARQLAAATAPDQQVTVETARDDYETPEPAGSPPPAAAAELPYRGKEDVPPWVGWVTVVAVLAVAAAAAVASVEHLADLARLAGTTGWKAWLLPVSVDGLATAAALTLYRGHRTGRTAGVLPWVALVAGLAASVAGNVASVYPELVDVGTLKIAVGATPPLSLALAVELALRQVRAT